jgi:hypothetical protein
VATSRRAGVSTPETAQAFHGCAQGDERGHAKVLGAPESRSRQESDKEDRRRVRIVAAFFGQRLDTAKVAPQNDRSWSVFHFGAEGWKLRGFYTSGGLSKQLVHADKVDILTLEGFIAIANQGQL